MSFYIFDADTSISTIRSIHEAFVRWGRDKEFKVQPCGFTFYFQVRKGKGGDISYYFETISIVG